MSPLKYFLKILLILTGLTMALNANPAPQPQISLTRGAGNTWNVDWESVPGRVYFMQYSIDLKTWGYMPMIEASDDPIHSYGFSSDSDKLFIRLRYIDIASDNPDEDD